MVNKGLNETELKYSSEGKRKSRVVRNFIIVYKVVNKQMLFKFYFCTFFKLITYTQGVPFFSC